MELEKQAWSIRDEGKCRDFRPDLQGLEVGHLLLLNQTPGAPDTERPPLLPEALRVGLPGKLLPWAETAASGAPGRFGERLSQETLLPFSGSERLKGPALESKARKGPELGAKGEGCWPALTCGGADPEGCSPHQGVIWTAERPRSDCT